MSTWATTRTEAIQAFNGETPGAETEQALIDLYEQHPALITAEITRVAEDLAEGQIRSGWAILNARCQQKSKPVRDATPNAGDRDKAIARADQWLKNAGLHFDHQPEIADELFGSRGLLRASANSTTLQKRMVDAWTVIRPTGEAIDAAELERAEHWRTHRPDQPKPKPRAVTTPPLPDEPEPADYDYGDPNT